MKKNNTCFQLIPAVKHFFSCLVLKVIVLFLLFQSLSITSGRAQTLLFDFNSANQYTPLPINQSIGGLTASFSSTGQGYSIQSAGTMGFTPAGFSGLCIYPSSVFLADLQIHFNQSIVDFSILYACQELACDDAETMRIRAYKNGNYVGTATRVATFPGTWPTDTLSFSSSLGFDSVVLHYDSPPPTCTDYGVIYLVDNMQVTLSPNAIKKSFAKEPEVNFSNPFFSGGTLEFTLNEEDRINAAIWDMKGNFISTLFEGNYNEGKHMMNSIPAISKVPNGIYFLKFQSLHFNLCYKIVVLDSN